MLTLLTYQFVCWLVETAGQRKSKQQIGNSKKRLTEVWKLNEDIMDDEKKTMAGKFCFAMLTLFSTSAFLCGLISTGFCSFAARNIELAEGYTPTRACREIGLDPLVCSVFLENHGVGFYYWQGTVASTETRCLTYTMVCDISTTPVSSYFDSHRLLCNS